jgi:U32 family peptidase
MKSLADELPPEIAKQIHPEWRKNEADYWAVREELLEKYRDRWIGFAGGEVIAVGTSPVFVFHAAEDSGRNPFVTCVGRENEPCRVRRSSFAYDTSYPGEPMPILDVEFRSASGASGVLLSNVILDTGADASALRYAVPTPPELLSPAGDFDCARAAVENGADAVYFGLRLGLNARTKARNFSLEELPEFMAYLHLRGVRGFVTLNTLVFPSELDLLDQAVRAVVSAGVDAAIVQDFGAARLIRAIAPDFHIHASTQMSITSAEGVNVARRLGIRRVVLARELSIDDLREIRKQTEVELEVFVHGALCMSYSGQCNASFGMGGRSANRGQCAQQCRLPYELVCDDEVRDLQDRKYLLSPSDLSAWELVPDLISAGVNSLKIEGRMKSPEYVASATRQYRQAIDEGMAGRRAAPPPEQLVELESPFSRGLSKGWLAGRNLQIVDGRNSANRGVGIGKVVSVHGDRVAVELTAPLRRGDGIAFPSILGEEHDQGGRVFEIFDHRQSVKEVSAGQVELAFQTGAIEFDRLKPGQELWKTSDPQIDRRLRKTFENGHSHRRVPLDLSVDAAAGRTLRVVAKSGTGATCRVESDAELEEARRHPLTAEVLREQFGRLGASVYELRDLDARIEGRPMVPLSVLGHLRHEMVRLMDVAAVDRPKPRLLPLGRMDLRDRRSEVDGLGGPSYLSDEPIPAHSPAWHVLCRELKHLEEVLALGVTSVIGDFAELHRAAPAVRMAREHGAEIYLATPRIQKPGEEAHFSKLADAKPDGLLVRNLGGADFCARRQLPFVADMTLNAVNPWSIAWLHELGARRVTAAYDADRRRLIELAQAAAGAELEVVVYQHIPLFHTEHCVFDTEVGGRRNEVKPKLTQEEEERQKQRRTAPCSFACMKHEVRLRDRLGVEHPLQSDACCRNTLYHADPRNLLDQVPDLRRLGVRHFRIELLEHVPQNLLRRIVKEMAQA